MPDTTQAEKEPVLIQPAAVADELSATWHAPLRSRLDHWYRLIFSFPGMLITMLAGLIFGFARRGLADPDLWWHLRNAQYLLTHHSFIRADMYSYTVIGHPWVNPEWFSEVPYYLAWRAFGLVGIKTVQLLLIEGIFFGLIYLCWRESRNIKASMIACVFAVFLAVVNFGPRTILFGYALLILLLALLDRFRSEGRAPLWIIPPLFCFWINTHGSWSLGMVVFGIIIAGGLVEGRWGKVESVRWSPSQLRKLLLAFGASVAALFANPYGWRLVFYPLDMAFHQKLNIAHIQEWQSVNFHEPRGKIVLILIIGPVLGALLSRYKWQLTELALVLFGVYSGLTYERFLFLAAILTAPLLAKFLDVVPAYRHEIDKPLLNALIMAGILVMVIRALPTTKFLRQSVDKAYPAEVLPYLKTRPPDGPVLNEFLFGGYLGWKDPHFKDFVDSRVDIFEYAGVFKDYIDLLQIKKAQSVLDKYGIRYVLFSRDQLLTCLLLKDPKWKVIFDGKVCVMFERIGPTPKPAVHLPLPLNAAEAW
jgi:hypothetical protein